MIRGALDGLLKIFVDPDFRVSKPRNFPLRNRFGLISSFHESAQVLPVLEFSACHPAGQANRTAPRVQANPSLDAGEAPCDYCCKGKSRCRGSDGDYPTCVTVKPRKLDVGRGQVLSLSGHSHSHDFYSLEVLFKPCPKPIRLEKTLLETKTFTV